MAVTASMRPFISLNPVVGCTMGCPYCYARSMNNRHRQVAAWDEPQFFAQRLGQLTRRQRPSVFFMTTMSDPSDWLPQWVEQIMRAVEDNPRHTYLFLSKRPEKLLLSSESPNIWLGCTVTRRAEAGRIEALKALNCRRRFVCFEPLLEDVGPLDLTGIDWVWAGPETGNRPERVICSRAWVEAIAAQCGTVPLYLHHSFGESMEFTRIHGDFIAEDWSLF